ERALEIEPQLWRAKTGLGYLALERNQPNAAIAYFRPAALHGHAEAFIGMGDAYRRIGRKREALDAYDTYLKRFPDGPRRSIAQHQSELLSEQLNNQRGRAGWARALRRVTETEPHDSCASIGRRARPPLAARDVLA